MVISDTPRPPHSRFHFKMCVWTLDRHSQWGCVNELQTIEILKSGIQYVKHWLKDEGKRGKLKSEFNLHGPHPNLETHTTCNQKFCGKLRNTRQSTGGWGQRYRNLSRMWRLLRLISDPRSLHWSQKSVKYLLCRCPTPSKIPHRSLLPPPKPTLSI